LYAQIAGIFKQFQVSTGTKQSRRNIKRWKDNCSTDRVRKNKSSFEYVKEGRYSPILPLKLTDRCGQTQKLQDLVVPKEMTLLNIIHAKQNLFAPQK
jgi:hypothetical protein